MEDAERLADIATKLEKFRYNMLTSMVWAMFGMIFGSVTLFAEALQLIGVADVRLTSIMLIFAGFAGGFLFKKFWRYFPEDRSIRNRWHLGFILMFIPFIVSYMLIPALLSNFLTLSGFYYSTVWYPSLGVGLFLCGIYLERMPIAPRLRSFTISGALMVLTSFALIPISYLEMNEQVILGSNLLTISMMIAIYLAASLKEFFGAQNVLQD